jgi:putative PIN family toxin of toxin-antitoxin system
MLRVTCDTNTLLRMAHAGPKSELYSAWRNGQLLLVLSEAICEELADVLGRPKTWRYVDEERGTAFLELLRHRAEFVTPSSDTPPCRDPDDLAIVGTALAGQVPYLVSSDKDLYEDAALVKDLKERGVRVVSASQVIAQLKN